jgi:hypothetical protein
MKLRLRRQRRQINHSSAAGFTRKLCTSGGAIPGELQDSSRDLPIEVLEHVTIFTNDSSAQNRRATHNHCGPILNVRTYFRCVRGFAPHNSKITIDIGARDSALHFNRFNPRDVQSNLASPQFGGFFNNSWREYREKFVLEF